jgi:hypothetical protein
MFIYCNDKVIKIENRGNAINIEIQFNLSEYGKEWREIGDALYNFTDIHVNSTQFNFMKKLSQNKHGFFTKSRVYFGKNTFFISG